MRGLLMVVLAAATLSSCAGATRGSRTVEAPEWSATLDLRVGSEQTPEYALTWFRGMAVGPSGRMYTLHPMEQLVRVFREDGTFEGYIGGRGEGPGEFQNVFNMGWVGDTLWVLDADGYRFSQFDSTGEFLGSFSVPFQFGEDPMSAGPPRASGLLFDGTVYGGPAVPSRLVGDGTVTSQTPVLMTRTGEVIESLPTVAFGNSTWAINDPDNPDQWGMYTRQPYADGPIAGHVPGERSVVHLNRESPETAAEAEFHLVKMSFAGDTIWSRSFPFEPVPVPAEEVDSLLDSMARMLGQRGNPSVAEGRAREWAALRFYRPDFKPGASAMLLGRDGSIWLRETGGTGEMAPWLVLDAQGEVLGRVPLPGKFTPMEADGELVWGSEPDEMEVPHLVRYRIMKS